MDLSVVSRHLATLEAAKILQSSKQGRAVFYSVNCDLLTGVLRNLAQAIEDCCNGESKLFSIKKGQR